jgi:hypothetical protein
MGDALAGLPLGQVSAGALVAIVVLLILTGRLVPRQQLLDTRADRDQWHTAADDWQATATKLGMSVERLLVHAETTTHALGEIQSVLERGLR